MYLCLSRFKPRLIVLYSLLKASHSSRTIPPLLYYKPTTALMSSTTTSTLTMSLSDQERLLHKLQVFNIQGRDKRGRQVLRVVAKFFPAKLVGSEALKKYLEDKIYPKLSENPFSVVYVHTGVERCENFPGFLTLRSLYEEIPVNVKKNLSEFYFVHPGLQSRLFFATFGRFLFSGGLYWKLKYVSRVEFLWDHVRRNEIEIPQFVFDHDEELECRSLMDYGLESDHPRVCYGSSSDNPISVYSMRCIA